jgi:rabenosyn-5
MDNDGEIRQGFICPICMRDLGDLERLHHHADNEHSGDDANLETVNLIKGLYFSRRTL